MKRQRAQELRAAIDRLPLSKRQAMLEGIRRHPIVVGGDANGRGGLCPMLAASRGSSKSVGRPFARAWDGYAGARMARPATERELLTLWSMLETSIQKETEPEVPLDEAISEHKMARTRARRARRAELASCSDLAEAIAEHRAAVARTEAERDAARSSRQEERPRPADTRERDRSRPADTGERDRSRELSRREGWAWLRPFRRYDDYERALLELEAAVQEQGFELEEERQLVSSASGRD